MNTSNAAAKTVGMDSRRITFQNRLKPLQPKLAEASIRLLSRLLNIPFM